MSVSKVRLNLPFGLGGIDWVPNAVQKQTAWKIYIELTTRVATQDIPDDGGADAEILSSLHALFGATRRILRGAGPGAGLSRSSVGGIAIAVLNRGLRPFLTKWRVRVSDSQQHAAFRHELQALTLEMHSYAELLAIMAGVGEQI